MRQKLLGNSRKFLRARKKHNSAGIPKGKNFQKFRGKEKFINMVNEFGDGK